MTALSMPGSGEGRQDDTETIVLGVDTHKDFHVAAVLTLAGALLEHAAFPTTASGYRQLVAWAKSLGTLRRAGVEDTGSYGTALTRHLRVEDIVVLEVNRPDRAARRRRGKTDTADAEAAGRAVISGQATTTPKSADGPVEMLRLFKLAKDSAIKARTQAINQLKAVLVTADTQLREDLAPLSNPLLVAACARLDPDRSAGPAYAARYTLRLLANRIQQLTAEIDELTTHITATIEAKAPQLLKLTGVGPDSAAVLLVTAGDNPERLTNEASFAALCGVSPLEASSGKTARRRLNRGGDRQAIAALYRITLSRLRWDQRSRTYLTKRTAEGKSRREIIRCLKRYIAREIHQHLTTPVALTPAPARLDNP
ncbi:IS110 family transposase [Micromonospora sp. NBC_01412]|uniref:IS110 family transposase n=1 Tax=Micromonospora sp. NBC_01412 TaxID=2903590 RepID=UPI00324F262C